MSQPEIRIKVRRLGIVLALLLGVVITALALRYQNPAGQGTGAPTVAGNENMRGSILPGESTNREVEALRGREEYFLNRYTYPVGYYDAQWLQEAYRQVANIPSGIPAGKVSYDRSKSSSPLALDPNALVSLGPRPGQADGCFTCFNYGLVSGRINSVAIDPVVTSTVYLGVSNGGVWKSTNCCNAGTTWSPVTDDATISTITVDEVTIDPTNNQTIYVATGDFRAVGAARGSQGILKSTDAGASWTVLGASVFVPNRGTAISGSGSYNAVSAVKVDPNSPNTLIAGTKTALWMSYDAGGSWFGPCATNPYTTTVDNQRQDNSEILVRDNGTSTTVYYAVGWAQGTANGANGVYSATMPTSGCPSWTLITRGDNGWPAGTGNGTASNSKPGRIDLTIAPSNPQIIYAVASDASTLGTLGFWRTTDGGETWQQRSTASALLNCNPSPGSGVYGQAFYDQAIDVDPNNPDVFVYGEVDVFKTTDGGQTFQNIGCVYSGGDYIHSDQHDFRYLPGSSNQVLFANDGGIWHTSNADVAAPTRPTIISMNSTLNTMEFYNGDITGNFANGPEPGANGGTQDNGSFVNTWTSTGALGPEEWQLRVGGDGFFANIEPVTNNTYYQSGNLSLIWKSIQGGYGPYNIVNPGGSTTPWMLEGRAFAMPYQIYRYDCPPTGCTHLIAGTHRVWETTNGAQDQNSWYPNSPSLTDAPPVCTSLNLGWSCAPNITQLSYAVNISDTAIAGTSDGNVWYGFNLGQGTALTAQWVNVTNGNAVLPNRAILDVATDPVTSTIGYAAVGGFDQATPSTPGHVFQVSCTSLCNLPISWTWTDKTSNLPNLPVDSIIVNPKFRQQVFVGTDSGLFFTNDIDAASPVWTRFTNGIPNVWVADLTIDRGFTTLAVWTRNRGLYVWPLPNAPFVQPSPTPTVTGTPPTATPTATAVGGGACYNYSVVTRTAASLIPATNNTGAICDDCAAQVQLPFPVTFYDQTYNQGYALTNGSFTFGPANLSYGSDCFPNRNESYSIHAYTTDLCTDNCVATSNPNPDPCVGCGIFTETIGTAPNRQFVVLWKAKYFSDYVGQATFEIIFTEGSSQVVVIYGANADDGASANAGVQRTAGSQYVNYSCLEAKLPPGLRIEYNFGLCPSGTATPTATVCPVQFQDVPQSVDVSSFYPYVRCLACRGVVSGYPCGGTNPETGQAEPCGTSNNAYYRPSNRITRGQISKMVSEASGLSDPPGSQVYEDVPPASPFFVWINRLSQQGVMGGYPCGAPGEPCGTGNRPYFRPGNNASRGQMAKIVSNAADFNDPVTGQSFEDLPPSNDPSSYYPYAERLYVRGIVGGYQCGGAGEPCGPEDRPYYRPNASVTRGQSAKIVANTFLPNCQTPARR